MFSVKCLIFGDWGLGIGDWAQSPIPNPPIPKLVIVYEIYTIILNNNIFKLILIFNR